MIIGSPLVTLLTIGLPKRLALLLALALFVAGLVVVALAGTSPSCCSHGSCPPSPQGRSGRWHPSSRLERRPASRLAARRESSGPEGSSAPCSACPRRVPRTGSRMARHFWAIAAAASSSPCCRPVRAERHREPREDHDPQRVHRTPSGRLWLTLLACVTTSGGVVSAFSYIAPLLTERAGGRDDRRPGRPHSVSASGPWSDTAGRSARRRPSRAGHHRHARRERDPAPRDRGRHRPSRPHRGLVAVLGLFGSQRERRADPHRCPGAGTAAPLGFRVDRLRLQLGTRWGPRSSVDCSTSRASRAGTHRCCHRGTHSRPVVLLTTTRRRPPA